MRTKNTLVFSIATISAAMAAGGTAYGQELISSRSAQLEEVIVTSRRVEESVQDIPLAVTALSSDQLERAGVKTLHGAEHSIGAAVAVGGPQIGDSVCDSGSAAG